MSVTDAKAAARLHAYRLRRDVRAAEGGGEAEKAAQDHLRAALQDHPGAVISGYLPILGEIDPLPVMTDHDGPVCVPLVQSSGMPLLFARWTHDVPLRNGPFGTREPADPEILVPEVLIVPLVAVDRWGHRLGNGGGFYDRTLESLRDHAASSGRTVRAIGFGFGVQIIDKLPREGTDQRLDALVTEDGLRTYV